ncbi:hypothetical protein AAHB37_12835 [Glutamicibacter halophytocola]
MPAAHGIDGRKNIQELRVRGDPVAQSRPGQFGATRILVIRGAGAP